MLNMCFEQLKQMSSPHLVLTVLNPWVSKGKELLQIIYSTSGLQVAPEMYLQLIIMNAFYNLEQKGANHAASVHALLQQ